VGFVGNASASGECELTIEDTRNFLARHVSRVSGVVGTMKRHEGTWYGMIRGEETKQHGKTCLPRGST
jgi:hypothetical protein